MHDFVHCPIKKAVKKERKQTTSIFGAAMKFCEAFSIDSLADNHAFWVKTQLAMASYIASKESKPVGSGKGSALLSTTFNPCTMACWLNSKYFVTS